MSSGSPWICRTTFPAATSNCAVRVILCAQITRGVHPRASCPARRPASTANSNAASSRGRCTIANLPFVIQHGIRLSDRPVRRTAVVTIKTPGVGEAKILLTGHPHSKGFGEGWAGWPRAQKSRKLDYTPPTPMDPSMTTAPRSRPDWPRVYFTRAFRSSSQLRTTRISFGNDDTPPPLPGVKTPRNRPSGITS